MANDFIAKLVLSKEEIVHLYHGGILAVRIKGKDHEASLEISCGDSGEKKRKQIRFKTIVAEPSFGG